MPAARVAAAVVIAGAAAAHLAWAMGSTLPLPSERSLAEAVTGGATMPPRPASAVVGLALLALAASASPWTDASTTARAVRRLGGSALLARGIVPTGILMRTLRLPTPAGRFTQLDAVAYRPACLALGAALWTR